MMKRIKPLPMNKRTRCPSHPGNILKQYYLSDKTISIEKFAENINIPADVVLNIMKKKSNIDLQIARKLALAFNTTHELWLNLQKNYDLWQTTHKGENDDNS